MPRVPMPEGPQATPGGIPQGRLVSPEASDFGARQLQGFGQALEGAGQVAGKIALDMQARADELRLTDAANKFKERQLTLQHDKDVGYLSVKGKNAFDRPDGKSLADHYDEQLAAAESDIAATLGTDRQKAAFQRAAGEMRLNFRGGVAQHESREYLGYQLSVAEGVQATALRDIELNWRSPDAVDAAVTRIKSEVYRQAKLTGQSAEWQEAQARKLTSNAHKVALMAALDQNDPSYADEYLKRYKDQMDGADILAVRGHITKAVDAQVGSAVGGEYAGQASRRLAPTDMDRMVQITIQSESGGNPNAVSPAGARGIMQVMPATAKNPGHGIKPSNGTPDDDARVGRDLLGALTKKYGDAGQTWAAYNAGERWVDEAQARAAKAQAGTPQADWFWQLNNDGRTPANRKQTQDYVTKNLAALNSGGGTGPRPTFADIDAGLRADPRLAGNPNRLKVARQEAERQFNENEKAIKQRGDEAVAEAMRGVMGNGGRFSDLPPALVAAIPPKEVDNVMNFAGRVAKGDDVTSPLLYQRLTENPQALKGLSEAEFFALRRELSEADFKHFSNERAKLLGAKGSGQGGAGDLNSSAINASLNDRLRQMKMDPTPKDGSDDALRVGTVRKFVNDYFIRAQQEAGKKFTDAEVAQHLDGLFAHSTQLRGWFSSTTAPIFGMKPGDIPGDDRKRIDVALKRQGVENPSDAQVLELYWRSRTTTLPGPRPMTSAQREAAINQIPR